MTRLLPSGLKPYRKTPVFDRDTVPPALLRDHATKAGVWGIIHVLRGELVYRIAGTTEVHVLASGDRGVIEPKVRHSVELRDDAAFFVEFWS
jgi:tellurite resistance-related uncharacterized protein